MSNIDKIEQHLCALQRNWEDECNLELLELCNSQMINSLPQSGILLKPGHKFLLILDPNDHFKYDYSCRFPEVTEISKFSNTHFF